MRGSATIFTVRNVMALRGDPASPKSDAGYLLRIADKIPCGEGGF